MTYVEIAKEIAVLEQVVNTQTGRPHNSHESPGMAVEIPEVRVSPPNFVLQPYA